MIAVTLGVSAQESEVRKIGDISTAQALGHLEIPKGYRVATSEEIKAFENIGMKMSYPIYTDIAYSPQITEYQYFTVNYYKDDNPDSPIDSEKKSRPYFINDIIYTIVETPGVRRKSQCQYILDGGYQSFYRAWNYPADEGKWRAETSGLYNMGTVGAIASGYVYLVRQ